MDRRTGIHVIAAAAALLILSSLAPSPVAAQTHRSAFGLAGGWATYGDLTPGLATENRLEAGWLAGFQMERWFGNFGRTGLRLNAGFTERPMEGSPMSSNNVYLADLDLMIRLLPAGRARWVAPYITVGAGGAHYNSGDDASPVGSGAYGDDPISRAHVLAGFGLDLGTSSRIGLRIEASDQIVLASVGQSPPSEGFPTVHNPRIQTAIQLRTGRLGAARVFAQAPPAPRVQPAPVAAAPVQPQPVQPQPVQPQPVRPVVDAEAVTRLESRVERREREQAQELNRLEERVAVLERAVSQRVAAAPDEAVRVAPQPAQGAMQSGRGLYTVQVGAFVEVETAHRWAARLEGRDLPVWLEDFRIRGMDVKRVRVGALSTRAEAVRLGRALERDYGWSVWIVALDGRTQLPAGAVRATTAFLSSR